MRAFGLISLLILAFGLSVVAFATPENGAQDKVMLEILEGDTAFLVETKKKRVWWIVGECRREIPIDSSSSSEKMIHPSYRFRLQLRSEWMVACTC